jgi:hypothetical protein
MVRSGFIHNTRRCAVIRGQSASPPELYFVVASLDTSTSSVLVKLTSQEHRGSHFDLVWANAVTTRRPIWHCGKCETGEKTKRKL